MTTAAPAQKPDAATAKPEKKPSTKLAQKMMPDVDPNSALLPPDKWILQTAYSTFKTHKGIRSTVLKMAGLSLLGVAAIGVGIVGAVMAPALIPAAIIGASAIGVAGASAFVVKKQAEKLKNDFLPDLIEIVKTKYLELKMNEMKAAWNKRAAEKRVEREAKKAADAIKAQELAAQQAKEAAAAAAAAQKAEEEKAAQKAAAKEQPEKPAESKVEKGKAFGKWLLKSAMEKAQEIGKPKQDDADKPAGPAGNDNATPPKNAAPKKSTPPNS